MADVTERGQLIIITGLVLAISFVVLALLLNTVIFTENLASRGTDFSGRDAIEYQRTVLDGVGGLVDAENDQDHSTNASVRQAVENGTTELVRLARLRHASRGTVADASLLTLHNGVVIRQTDPSRTLNDSSNVADWTLAQDISDTRAFSMTIDGPLNTTTQPEEGFTVTLEGNSGNTWQVFVYDNSGVKLGVKNGSGPIIADVCTPVGLPVTINLTAGTVDGTVCSAISFANGINEPYDIRFEDGHHATGTYNLTVNVSGPGSVTQTSLNGPGAAGSPYFSRAVYSVVVDLHYETDQLSYGIAVRVAPGEPE